ncbi:MAG TPA: 4-(cytidine 5'-diphospho)-2-C-methyl-D-erythritol kinase [Alphaproteobacteria bacterium]
MKIIAPAKINLMLHYVGRREDGYHLMQSAVAFADIGDMLEIAQADAFSLTLDGPFAAHAPTGNDNLVARAAAGAPIAVRLTKTVPAGAGLGGGSADAAAILKYLDAPERALGLGADVPVSLQSMAQWMENIGDVLSPIKMEPLHAVLVWPGQGLSTPAMYAAYRESGKSFHDAIAKPNRIDLEFLQSTQNDFTEVAIKALPIIKNILDDLYAQDGCVLSRLSGSGSACFGIYQSAQDAKKAADNLSAAYSTAWIKSCVLV